MEQQGNYLSSDILNYLQRTGNVIKDGRITVSREWAGNKEFIYVDIDGINEPLFQGFSNKKHKRKPCDETANIEKKPIPKGTGGKPSYAMLFLRNKDIIFSMSESAQSLYLKLMHFIEWSTNRIINLRTKKPYTFDGLSKACALSRNKMIRNIKELKNNNLIYYDKEERAYFISRSAIAKGGKFDEDTV